jgi:hypothetical protein
MAFIPADARWYWADIVLEHTIEDDARNVIHINMHLIEADSPEMACEKSMALGRSCEMKYANSEGKEVRVKFRGLRQLDVLHDGLGDGEEITYKESVDVPKKEVRKLRTAKRKLNVFMPIEPKVGQPNTMAEDIVKMLDEQGFDRELLEAMAGIRRKKRQ